jgi:hypothetical protein
MAPIVAVGSSVLVAGSPGIAGATTKKANATIKICKSVAGTLRFSVDGRVLSLSSRCGVVTAKSGLNRVSEIWAPASYKTVASISVSPVTASAGASVKTATANVKLAAHGTATVSFVNTKVVVQVASDPSSPPVGNPDPSSPPVGNSDPPSPPVGNPDPSTPLPAGSGYIEVCKYAADGWVEGSFPFTVTAGTTDVGTYSVPVGQCTGDITVPAGAVTVTEANEAPYSVSSVAAQPLGNLVSSTLGVGGSGTFTVVAGQETVAQFWNTTDLGWFKVCKILQNDEGSLAGKTFGFDISWTFTPPNGAAPITATGTASVVAVDASVPQGACVEPTNNWPDGIPQGSTVTITEQPFPDVTVSGVAITPETYDAATASTPAGTAVLTVPWGGYAADATFTNDPMGYVEVCKNFDPSSYDATNTASFTVNGGTPVTVQGGACSTPIEVPAGTATVSESLSANPLFYLSRVSTVSSTDPTGARLLSVGGPSVADPTALPVNPASVTVPYGDISNETVVTFTDTVDPTQFKICKQETSEDAKLSGSTFYFDWSYSYDGNTYSDSAPVALTIDYSTANPQGTVCSGLIDGPPAVDEAGDVVPVAISEETTSIPAVETDSITYSGGGKLVYDSTDGGSDPVQISDGDSAGSCIDPGPGINIVTFTNGRTPGYVIPS